MVNGMKALITGSNGFIGSHLAALLKKKGYSVRCLVRKTSNLDLLKDLTDDLEGIDLFYGDVTDSSSLENAVQDVDVVFHLAAVLNAIDQEEFDRVNVAGTKNLYEAILKRNPDMKRVVLVSSFAAAGAARSKERPARESDPPKPVTRYGLSKLKAEMLSKKYSSRLPIVIVRPPMVFGEGDLPSLDLFRSVKSNVKLYQNTPEKYVSTIDASELSEALILCAENQKAIGETFYFAFDEMVSYTDFHEIIGNVVFNKRYGSLIPLKLPLWLYWTLVWLLECLRKLTGNILLQNLVVANGRVYESLEPYQIVSTEKAKQVLKWRQKGSLIKAIERTGKWYVERKWL